MPVHALGRQIAFPLVEMAEPDGLLAVGGDLSPARLIHAYTLGIFPWYGPGAPILWWSPDPRLVLFPEDLHIPRSLRRVLNSGRFCVTYDTCFDEVIAACANTSRRQGPGTWLVPEMQQAYCLLHQAGVAHSVEVWEKNDLVGGLYGLALGRAFFGESMFHARANASKVALVDLIGILRAWKFQLVDCQQTTEHMLRHGAREIPRQLFLKLLQQALEEPSLVGPWTDASGGGHPRTR
ncbi:MAG TPA: leucyl/phenylalanyl-tRNA--protein transferase [Desulfonatronum sp.]|nr:leucyl/phenylalanyl-tRNA--protein transferase [Desulfonatronum sp.]